jgi:hypothetical protein
MRGRVPGPVRSSERVLTKGERGCPSASAGGGSAARFACSPLRGAVFGGNGQTPPVARGGCAEHESMRRYASLGRHWLDPVCLFHRQVRDAWGWPCTPGEVLEQHSRITSPDPKIPRDAQRDGGKETSVPEGASTAPTLILSPCYHLMETPRDRDTEMVAGSSRLSPKGGTASGRGMPPSSLDKRLEQVYYNCG